MRISCIQRENFTNQNYALTNAKKQYTYSTTFKANPSTFDILAPKIIELFTTQGNKLPQYLLNIKKSSDNILLKFEKMLSNGNMLTIEKHISDSYRLKKSYLVFKESGEDAYKFPIGMDLNNGNLIYLDKSSNAPIYMGKRYKEVRLYDPVHAEYEAKVEEYLSQIFNYKKRPSSKGPHKNYTLYGVGKQTPKNSINSKTATPEKKQYVSPTVNVNIIRH